MTRKYAITIDPGLRKTGVAVWKNTNLGAFVSKPSDFSELVAVFFPENLETARDLLGFRGMFFATCYALGSYLDYPLGYLVIEGQQIYQSGSHEMPQLAGVCGALSLIPADNYISLLPKKWKRNLKKNLMEHHAKPTLSDTEYTTLKAFLDTMRKDERHNVWDAVGIGLVWNKRLHIRRSR